MITNKTARDFIIAKKLFPDIGTTVIETDTASGARSEFETNMVAPIVSYSVNLDVRQASGTPTPENHIPIYYYNGASIYNNGSVTSFYFQPIWGGSISDGNGTITFDEIKLGSLTWNKASGYYYSTSLRELVKSEGTGFCESLKNASSGDNTFRFTNNGDIIVISATYNAMTKEEFIEDTSDIKLLYELATPETFTYTDIEMSTVNGSNSFYLFQGNGNISITYKKKVPGPTTTDKRQFLPLIYGKKFKYNERRF